MQIFLKSLFFSEIVQTTLQQIFQLRRRMEILLEKKQSFHLKILIVTDEKPFYSLKTMEDCISGKKELPQTLRDITKRKTRKWHSESADPAKALGPSDILDRKPVVELWPMPKLSISSILTEFLAVLSRKSVFKTGMPLWPHRGSNSRPSRFKHNALTNWAMVS